MKRTKNIFKALAASSFLTLFFLTFLLPLFSALAADYVPLAPIPGTMGTVSTPCQSGSTCGTDLPTYLAGVFKVGVALAGVFAFFTIVWGGATYLSTDAITGKEEGKARVQRALGGLVLALAAYIILNTINPQLVKLNLNFGSAALPKQGLSAPSDYIPLDNEPAVLDLATLTADTRGKISKDLNNRIQALDTISQTRALTPDEEQEMKDLSVVRDGTVAINRIDAAQVNILNGLNGIGFLSTLAKNAQAAVEQLRIETDTRIAAMSADGATVGQMAVVRRSFNKVVKQVNDCIAYRKNLDSANFAAHCK